MPPTILQSRISAFESLAGGSSSHAVLNASPPSTPPTKRSQESLIDAPLSAAATAALPPVASFSSPSKATNNGKLSPSPSPPNLGRKTSLIDLKDWIVDEDPMLPPALKAAATLKPKPVVVNGTTVNTMPKIGFIDGKTPTQPVFTSKRPTAGTGSTTNGFGPLINLESPPRPKPKPAALLPSPVGKSPPPLPPRKATSYTSLKSVASTSSSQSSGPGPGPKSTFLYPPRRADSLAVDAVHSYPPSPLANDDSRSRHAAGSSISSFHSVSLSSDTESSTPGSISNFVASYPIDYDSKTSETDSISTSLTESYEDVSTTSLASPATERMITLDFERARAKRNSKQAAGAPISVNSHPSFSSQPPKLPQRPSSSSSSPYGTHPTSSRSSVRSPPPLPPLRPPSRSSQARGSSTPRSTPGSPIMHPSATPIIPTTYAVRRAPPPPPSRASDRSSIQSTATSYSVSSSSQQSHQSSLGRKGSANSSPVTLKVKRPTPVPMSARIRYEALFNGNVLQQKRAEKQQRKLSLQTNGNGKKAGLLSPNEFRGRRAAGWRGLSVDLITGGPDSVMAQLQQQGGAEGKETDKEEEEVDEVVGKDEKLEGSVVRLIWSRSGLDKRRLAEIWNECDPAQTGSLGVGDFVKGMWRIDEELRRAQTQLIKRSSNASLASLASRQSRMGAYPKSSYRPPRNLLQ